MKAFFAAWQFLTIIPLPQRLSAGTDALKKGVPFFPLIGLIIGFLAIGLDLLVSSFLPQFPASVILVIFLTGISGGLHMDGLADTADGFLSSRPREKKLEIMRDSHIGVMGVIAVVFDILIKVAVLSSLPADYRTWAIFLMPLAGRTAIVIMMTFLSYVRKEGGLATIFGEGRNYLHVLWAMLILLGAGWLAAGWSGLVAGTASLIAAAMFMVYAYRQIGGFTGDTLGAICEITEIMPPLVLLIWATR